VAGLEIRETSATELDLLAPLWASLHAHHTDIGHEVAPMRDLDESWRRRRRDYESWLAAEDTVILRAELDGRAVGYLTLRVSDGPHTWDIGRVGTIETLSVLPEQRGAGVGSELMDAARREAASRGAESMAVGVVHTNRDAVRFYERQGFGSFYLELVGPVDRPSGG
jgi:ribosomal protein S18 acetylase RimI-like enzyme